MSIATELICDRCDRPFIDPGRMGAHNNGPDRAKGHTLRHEAKSLGWSVGVDGFTTQSRQGWRDFCPDCREVKP
jgi:hypothetical protein